MTTKTKPLNIEIFELAGFYKPRPMTATQPHYEGHCWQDAKLFYRFAVGKEPLIHENFQLTLDWLVPIMRERGWMMSFSGRQFSWCLMKTRPIVMEIDDDKCIKDKIIVTEEIINDNVALAACEAALPILEALKKEKG